MSYTRNYKAGSNTALYIGLTEDASDDADFIRITNETGLEFEFTAENDSDMMKGSGGHKVTNPGVKSYSISVETAENYTDAGFTLLRAAHNVAWPFQVREEDTAPGQVIMSGLFIPETISYSAGAQGSRKANASLVSSGIITTTPRAVVVTP